MLRILALIGLAMATAGCTGDSQPGAGRPGTAPAQVFEKHCATCHENPALGGVPQRAALSALHSEAILRALTDGKMQQQGKALTPAERSAVAQWIADDSAPGVDWKAQMACRKPLRLDPSAKRWIDRWGIDGSNSRHQTASTLNSGNVQQLEQAWSIAFPGTTTMRSQPVIIGDLIYVAVHDLGAVYALDRATGCLHWEAKIDGAPRSALAYADLGSDKPVLLIGDEQGFVSQIDARSGSVLWRERVGENALTAITGPVVVDGDRFFVPHSTTETLSTTDPEYECCRAAGAVSAHDLQTGRRIWVHRLLPAATSRGVNSAGNPSWGPAGASVWSAPVIDSVNRQLIFGTGPVSALPDLGVSDSVVAIDLDSGKRRWVYQATPGDLWNGACRTPYPAGLHPNCPGAGGVDYDFGAGMIIARKIAGRDLLIAGQKSGTVHALDLASGETVWQNKIGSGGLMGGVHWGMALNGNALFVPVNDLDLSKNPALSESYRKSIAGYVPRSGVYRLAIETGRVEWSWLVKPHCKTGAQDNGTASECPPQYGMSGAALAVNDLVLSGAMNGTWYALNQADGRVMFRDDTYQVYSKTLSGQQGHGGSISNSTLVAADDMVFVQSGYAHYGGSPGNMLIAYKLGNGSEK